MSRVAIVTDTNSSMTKEECDALGVYLLPMPVIINGKEYFEGVNIGYEEFFRRLDMGAEVSSSQPSPTAVMELWEQALKENDTVVHIPMSSALSGSYATAAMLAQDYPGKVYVVDNRRISITMRRSVLQAVRLKNEGKSAADIALELERTAGDNSIYLAVQTLALLKKSGRVTPAGAMAATVLGINPVLQIQGGKLDAFKKERGMKRAGLAMMNAIDKDLAERFAGRKMAIDLAYSGDIANAEAWREICRGHFTHAEVELYRLPLSICCHVAGGVQAIGISCE